MKNVSFSMILALVSPLSGAAQVNWGAIYDFEFRKGGDGSALDRNEVINSNAHFSVHRLQLFMDASIDDHIDFTAKLANNVVIGDALKEIELQLVHVTFTEIGGQDFNVSLGRILTPFGQFAKRQLSPDNPLIGSPLYFQYQLKISSTSGYRPDLAGGGVYSGLSTMYLGGYYLGAEVYGSLFHQFLDYDVAVMNGPLSSFNTDFNTNGELSFHGRIGIRPVLFLSVGTSLNYGSFMDRIPANSFLEELERYKQLTVGLDLTLDWKYYKLVAEYIHNRWNAPFRRITGPVPTGPPEIVELKLVNREILVDLKVDLPFIVGAYVAGRFDLLEFDTIDDPRNPGTTIRWDNRIRRYAVGVGYKVSRLVLLKAGYEWSLVDADPEPYLNVWGGQVSVVF